MRASITGLLQEACCDGGHGTAWLQMVWMVSVLNRSKHHVLISVLNGAPGVGGRVLRAMSSRQARVFPGGVLKTVQRICDHSYVWRYFIIVAVFGRLRRPGNHGLEEHLGANRAKQRNKHSKCSRCVAACGKPKPTGDHTNSAPDVWPSWVDWFFA